VAAGRPCFERGVRVSAPTAVRNMSQLIAITIAEAMEADENVVVIGEDVGGMGGVFGATRGLQRRFGDRRVRDTPISEQTFVGAAVAMAQAGLRPIVEVMFIDFLGACLDQVANQMAKNHYMSGGRVRVPLVLRSAVGCIGDAAQHSQVLTGTLAHFPGLKVAFPSSPGDARGLLRTAIESDDPVVFLEHKHLLMAPIEDLQYPGDPGTERLPFEAAVLRPGADVTIVASGWMVQLAGRAAETLASEGADCEVVDLRTIVPLDMDTVLESARRTGRLLVVDEDYRSFGVSGEIMARVMEAGFGGRIQMVRHCLPDIPIPASKPLEGAVIPSPNSIAAAVRQLVSRGASQ
jgi:pyruvate/2-oxoglutarate/acetoin dehydrogenase E1 component